MDRVGGEAKSRDLAAVKWERSAYSLARYIHAREGCIPSKSVPLTSKMDRVGTCSPTNPERWL